VQLQASETLLQFDPQAGIAQLKQAQATVRSGIQEWRRAIQALRAAPLEELGLSEALRQLGHRFNERTEIPVAVAVAEVGVLDPLTEQAVYRVAEAALANVEQHAAANQVQLNLVHAAPAGSLRLEIADDGVGFDRSTMIPDRYGLTGMAEWAELAGADLRIETAPGQGTRIILERARMTAIRVLIVDDQAVVRHGLGVILSHRPDIEVVGFAADGQEALEQTETQRPDVVLMDLKMPRMNGIQATRQLVRQHPTIKVVVLTTYDGDEWGVRCDPVLGPAAICSRTVTAGRSWRLCGARWLARCASTRP
jgi:CheY-like chemotaxis protein